MKTKNIEQIPKIQRHLLSALAGFALICSGLGAQAQDLIINSFDTDESGTLGLNWANFRGNAYASSVTYSWDATQDSTGNSSSGSMYVTVNWPTSNNPAWNEGWNDVQFGWNSPDFDPANYISFDFDIKVDVANSALSADGWSYGVVGLYLSNPSWTQVNGWINVAPIAGWQHISASFSAIPSGTYNVPAIGFISDGTSSPIGPVSYWIDNIRFTAPMTVFTNRPTLSLAKAPPAGLTCICSQSGDAWQRQMVQTVNSNYSWYGHTPTTYSMNIAACPGVNYPGFESQMFLIPGAGLVAGGSVDWYSANVVDLFVGENPDGTGSGTFQYKVNNQSSGNMALAVSIPCATGPLGPWSLTFSNNINVTITAPDHTSTNFTIPASDASLFQDPLFVYVGTMPGGGGNIGQSSTFSQVQVSGSAGSINDTFASLNTNTWALYVEDAPGVFVTTTDAKYWVTWPLPDYGATNGFTSLYASDNLKTQLSSSHSLPTADTGWINVGSATRLTIVKQSTLNTAFGYAPTNCFFGLFHP